jgi:hypothetical protein
VDRLEGVTAVYAAGCGADDEEEFISALLYILSGKLQLHVSRS